MIHKINGIEYEVMGGITTAQQYDFARDALYNFVKHYSEAIKDGVNSVFLTFPKASDMFSFLGAILTPKGEQWSVENQRKISKQLAKRMIEPKILEKVVEDFFQLNAEWAGISPVLQAAEARMFALLGQSLIQDITKDSKDFNELLQKASAFMTTYSGRQTETSS